MKWKNRIKQYDKAALIDLTNAGLVRRAQKQVAEHKVALVEQQEDCGEFTVGGNSVKLFTAFPEQTFCDCKTSGICVHLLAAALHTQQEAGDQVDNEQAITSQESITAELLHFEQDVVLKWAGKAGRTTAEKVLHAFAQQVPQIIYDDHSMEIILDTEVRCRFVAGAGLNGIICQAPDSRRKGIICACILAWRRAQGETLSLENESGAVLAKELSQDEKDMLQELNQKLETILHVGLMHVTENQIMALRGLAWTVKGEGLPRLSAMILQLAGAFDESRKRSGKIDSNRLLGLLSNLWVECQQLLNSSVEQLAVRRGQSRRIYLSADLGPLWIAGASQYTTLSGASGVSVIAWDIKHNAPYQINIGRSAGLAHTLDSDAVWSQVLPWKKGTAIGQLTNKVIKLGSVKLSEDGRISLSKETELESTEEVDSYNSMIEKLGISEWGEIRKQLEDMLSNQQIFVAPLFVLPKQISPFVIDPYEQQWVSSLKDKDGTRIKIVLPVNDINNQRVKQFNNLIEHHAKYIKAMILEPRIGDDRVYLVPVSAVLFDKKQYLCFSPDYEQVRGKVSQGFMSRLISKITKSANEVEFEHSQTQGLEMMFGQISDYLTSITELGLDCQLGNAEQIQKLGEELETTGAVFMADVINKVRDEPCIESILRANWIFNKSKQRLYLDHIIE